MTGIPKYVNMGIIHAKPEGQTIFEEPHREKETFAITKDFGKWSKAAIEEHIGLYKRYGDYHRGHTIHDEATAQYISKYFDGYSMAPVALLDGEPIQCESHKLTYEDLCNFEEFINRIAADKLRYLYRVEYYYPHAVYESIDQRTHQIKTFDKPTMTQGMWKIRFGKAEKK